MKKLVWICQVSVISSVLSHLNKNLKRWTLKPSVHHGSWTDRVTAPRQISVTGPCYSSVLLRNSRKIHPWGVRACWPKDSKRREREKERDRKCTRRRDRAPGLRLLFLCFFLPLGLPYVNLASKKCCSFYLSSSFWSLELPLTFLFSIFAGFSLPCLLLTAILDSCFLF